MHSSDLFERILARLTTPGQAAAIVGDHLETASTCKLPFWLTMSGIVLALAWRRPASWLAGMAGGLTMMWLISHVFNMWHRLRPAALRPDLARTLAYILVTGLTMLLAFAAPYAALRIGLRDRYTRLCAVLWCIAFVGFLLQPYRSILIAIAATCLTLLLISLLTRWRAAAVEVLANIFAGVCGMILAGFWEGFWYRHHRLEYGWLARHTLWGYNVNPLVAPLVMSLILLTCLATASSHTHNWAARKGDPATQLET